MKKYPLRGAHRIICSVVIVLLIVGQPAYASEAVRNDSPYFNEMMDFIKDHYYGEVSDEMLFEGAVKGMFYIWTVIHIYDSRRKRCILRLYFGQFRRNRRNFAVKRRLYCCDTGVPRIAG